MTVQVGEAIRVTLEYTLAGGNVAQNVRHYRNDAGSPQADQDAVDDMEIFANLFAGFWQGVASNVAVISLVRVSIFQGGLFIPIGSANLGIIGGQGSEQMPHGVCGLARGSVTGTTGQWRVFTPGVPENLVVNGTWTVGAVATLVSLGNVVVSVIDPIGLGAVGTWTPGVLTGVPVPTFKTLIGNSIGNAIPAYQRRRKPGVGI